jgi:uncharacterized protein (DUF2249 family)
LLQNKEVRVEPCSFLPRVRTRLEPVKHTVAGGRDRLNSRNEADMNTRDRGRTVLDVREIPGRERHATIFSLFEALQPGEDFELVNDHDPVPLRFQFEALFPGSYAWDYLAQGPEEYRIRIIRR